MYVYVCLFNSSSIFLIITIFYEKQFVCFLMLPRSDFEADGGILL